MSGPANFRAKLASFRLVEDPWCATCGEGVEETAWQVLADCPEFINERTELTEYWNAHSGEHKLEIVYWNPEFFKIFTKAVRKVGGAKEDKGVDDPQE